MHENYDLQRKILEASDGGRVLQDFLANSLLTRTELTNSELKSLVSGTEFTNLSANLIWFWNITQKRAEFI